MKTHFISNNSNRLILFFNGWSMDENHLTRLNSSDYDILICSDYQDLSPETFCIDKLKSYSDITIISWSMGVFISNKIRKHLNNINYSIAINGTLKPISDLYGIPESIFDATVNNFNIETREKFYKRMFKSKEDFEKFLLNQPKRATEEQKAELIALQNYIIDDQNDENSFNRVIIGKYDKIIPAKNQNNAWCEAGVNGIRNGCDQQALEAFSNSFPINTHNPIIIEEGHYPFFLWQSYEEIIEYAKNN